MAAGDGLISMKPTSIAYSGTSASINADGGVDFSAVTSLSLNGVFTGDYDNYLIVLTGTIVTSNQTITARFRASGADASGSNYTSQLLEAAVSSVSGLRYSSETSGRFVSFNTAGNNGKNIYVYGPALAQPTAFRSVTVNHSPAIVDFAGTHSLSTSYDGITIFPAANNITGNIHVFGYEE